MWELVISRLKPISTYREPRNFELIIIRRTNATTGPQFLHHSKNLSVDVRLARADDATTIAEYTRNMAWETEQVELESDVVNKGVQSAFEDSSHGFYVVAEIDNEIAGCLMVTYEWSDWRNGVQWWLQSVYVHSDFRGKGVFKRMWEFTTNLASQQPNVCGIRLYVDKSNKRAQATYQSIGMEATNYLIFETTLRKP